MTHSDARWKGPPYLGPPSANRLHPGCWPFLVARVRRACADDCEPQKDYFCLFFFCFFSSFFAFVFFFLCFFFIFFLVTFSSS